jgi:hypothetical protein
VSQNAQDTSGGQVLCLNTPPAGVTELRYTIIKTGVGTQSVNTQRPDLIVTIDSPVAGQYVLTVLGLPDVRAHAVTLQRGTGSAAVGVAADIVETTGYVGEVGFLVVDAAGAAVTLTPGDRVNGVISWVRQSGGGLPLWRS